MTQPCEDFAKWERGIIASYAGFTISPKKDFGKWEKPQEGCPKPHGWVVCGEFGTNALPGGTWAKSFEEASALINVYAAVGGKPGFLWATSPETRDEAAEVGQKFWHLLNAIRFFGKVE